MTMKLSKLVQQTVNGFCAQTGLPSVNAGSLIDVLYDIDPVEANAFLARPDITPDTVLNPSPVAVD
jgi:hypothetical protein